VVFNNKRLTLGGENKGVSQSLGGKYSNRSDREEHNGVVGVP